MKKILIILTFGLLFLQCNNHYEYSEMVNVNNTWNKKDTLNFNVNISDAISRKNINLVVRNNNDYPFSNLYLFIKMKEGKKTISLDTLNYKLADNTGKWLGSGVGSVKEIYLQYKKDFKFPKNGKYTISIVQGIRKDTLKGIEDLGVNIE